MYTYKKPVNSSSAFSPRGVNEWVSKIHLDSLTMVFEEMFCNRCQFLAQPLVPFG